MKKFKKFIDQDTTINITKNSYLFQPEYYWFIDIWNLPIFFTNFISFCDDNEIKILSLTQRLRHLFSIPDSLSQKETKELVKFVLALMPKRKNKKKQKKWFFWFWIPLFWFWIIWPKWFKKLKFRPVSFNWNYNYNLTHLPQFIKNFWNQKQFISNKWKKWIPKFFPPINWKFTPPWFNFFPLYQFKSKHQIFNWKKLTQAVALIGIISTSILITKSLKWHEFKFKQIPIHRMHNAIDNTNLNNKTTTHNINKRHIAQTDLNNTIIHPIGALNKWNEIYEKTIELQTIKKQYETKKQNIYEDETYKFCNSDSFKENIWTYIKTVGFCSGYTLTAYLHAKQYSVKAINNQLQQQYEIAQIYLKEKQKNVESELQNKQKSLIQNNNNWSQESSIKIIQELQKFLKEKTIDLKLQESQFHNIFKNELIKTSDKSKINEITENFSQQIILKTIEHIQNQTNQKLNTLTVLLTKNLENPDTKINEFFKNYLENLNSNVELQIKIKNLKQIKTDEYEKKIDEFKSQKLSNVKIKLSEILNKNKVELNNSVELNNLITKIKNNDNQTSDEIKSTLDNYEVDLKNQIPIINTELNKQIYQESKNIFDEFQKSIYSEINEYGKKLIENTENDQSKSLTEATKTFQEFIKQKENQLNKIDKILVETFKNFGHQTNKSIREKIENLSKNFVKQVEIEIPKRLKIQQENYIQIIKETVSETLIEYKEELNKAPQESKKQSQIIGLDSNAQTIISEIIESNLNDLKNQIKTEESKQIKSLESSVDETLNLEIKALTNAKNLDFLITQLDKSNTILNEKISKTEEQHLNELEQQLTKKYDETNSKILKNSIQKITNKNPIEINQLMDSIKDLPQDTKNLLNQLSQENIHKSNLNLDNLPKIKSAVSTLKNYKQSEIYAAEEIYNSDAYQICNGGNSWAVAFKHIGSLGFCSGYTVVANIDAARRGGYIDWNTLLIIANTAMVIATMPYAPAIALKGKGMLLAAEKVAMRYMSKKIGQTTIAAAINGVLVKQFLI